MLLLETCKLLMPGLLISYTVCYRFRTPELVLTIINLAFEHVSMSIRVIFPYRTVKFSFLYVLYIRLLLSLI